MKNRALAVLVFAIVPASARTSIPLEAPSVAVPAIAVGGAAEHAISGGADRVKSLDEKKTVAVPTGKA